MKYVLLVKGDGRGHLTQALALASLLEHRGHSIEAFIVGMPASAKLPAFFQDRVKAPVIRLESPNMKLSASASRIHWAKTALDGLIHFGAYRSAVQKYHDVLVNAHPDVVINLFDPLATLHKWTYGCTRAHVVHVSHQALLLHPRFQMPPGRSLGRNAVVHYTRFIDQGADKTLALSFYEMPPATVHKLTVVPPLLRKEVLARTPSQGEHILAYMVYPGVAEALKAFNLRHPQVRVHAFWHNPDQPERIEVSPTLTFHQVHDTKFLDLLASCRGVVTTAGFETVCEALYYRKPALLMPMPGQFEQQINAYDAQKVGAGLQVNRLDPEPLLAFSENYNPDHATYLDWLKRGQAYLLFHLEHPCAAPDTHVEPSSTHYAHAL